MRDLVAFYHLATMGHYKEVNAEILGILKHSGLLKQLKAINIGVVGDKEIDLLYEHPKFNIKVLDSYIGAFEYPTINWLREYCKENDCYALYFANVGVSHDKDRDDYYPGWRDLDCHYCLMKWRECIDALENGFDCVSVEWQTDPCRHFSGSFFWVTSEYVRTLPDLEEAKKLGLKMVNSHRHGTEFWIGMNPSVKYKSLFQTGHSWRSRPIIDWYKEAMNREERV